MARTFYITLTQKHCSPKYAAIQEAKNAIVEWQLESLKIVLQQEAEWSVM